MSNEIVPIIPRDYDSGIKMAKAILASGLAPKLKTEAQVFIAMQLGACVGLAPMQAVQSISVINGKPTIGADAMLAIAKASGLLESIKENIEGEGKDLKAVCKVKRKGDEVVIQEFSVADAEKAGLWGKSGPWMQYPERMLAMRARSFVLRDVFPDVLLGLAHSTEEMQDTVKDEPRDITPNSSDIKSPSEWRFIDLDGQVTIDMTSEEAFGFIADMISAIKAKDDTEAYVNWKTHNSLMLNVFIKECPGLAKELGELYKLKINQLNNEENNAQ